MENGESIMVAGSARPLLDAFRIAHVEMVKWLVLSQVGSARVANVVYPNSTVEAKFPKKCLPR